MNERERKLEPTVTVKVTFKRSTLEKVNEAASMLGLSVEAYIAVGAVVAAREDIGRKDLLMQAGVRKEA
jgi:hypothetical protein